MKKILFFIENNWAFGKIHNELIKVLMPEVYCDIIDWRVSYSLHEMDSFIKKYDYIITTPHGASILGESYKVPLDRIGVVAHSNGDITHIIYEKNLSREYFNKFKSYAVVSERVRTMSISHDIYRIPYIVEIGCFRKNYIRNKSIELKTIGYVGALQQNYNLGLVDIKRGHLVIKISELTQTKTIHFYNLNFLCAEHFYTNIDLLMFSSLTESLPMPPMEAFCSGIPVLGTDVGIFPDLARSGGGIILPFDENEYLESGVKIINDLKQNSERYQNMSQLAYDYSEKLDWSHKKQSWLKFIDSLYM